MQRLDQYAQVLSEQSRLPIGQFFMNWRGLNHLTFTDAVYDRAGKNILPELLEKLPDGQPSTRLTPR